MIIKDLDNKEWDIDPMNIDKATFYLKMEDRKRVDFEYFDVSKNSFYSIAVQVSNVEELLNLYREIGNTVFKENNID